MLACVLVVNFRGGDDLQPYLRAATILDTCQGGRESAKTGASSAERMNFRMKAFLKRVLQAGMACWPTRLKAAVANLLCRDETFIRTYGRDLIAQVAPICGIDGVRATGNVGDILSSPSDRTVFATYAMTGSWAASTNALFTKFFTKNGGGTYLDIGANIGLTTIPIARLPNVQCFAFEPAPENFRNLKANVRANCDPDKVKTFQVALFESESQLDFELSDYNLGDHRISLNGSTGPDDAREVVRVRAVPLDSLDLVRGTAGLAVKIDTQGAEPFVIAGGRKTLADAQLLAIEWWPYMMARMGADPMVVLNFLRATFKFGGVCEAESDVDNRQFSPMDQICDQLLQTIVTQKDNEKYYVDIVATKQ
jgi:FkbM family methyltransferase